MLRGSIRLRLLLGLTVAILVTWALLILATWHGISTEVRALFDTQLEQSARVATRTLLGIPAAGDETAEAGEEPESRPDPPRDQYKKDLIVQVWNDRNELVLRSKNAPLDPLAEVETGFSNAVVDGDSWRTYSFQDPEHGLTIRVGEPYRPREYLARHVVQQALYPVLIGLPLIALLIWFAVGRGLGPLSRLAAEVHRRSPENLDAIRAPYAPREVRPLVDELNALLGQLKTRIEQERRFIGDAAHELRTPLAGLGAHAEVALAAREPREREHALASIVEGVRRAGHLVDQLLTLSRLEESAAVPAERVALGEIARIVLADLRPAALSHSISLEFREEPEASDAIVRGSAEGIYVLMRNLVDNAIRYSPQGAEVSLSLERAGDEWRIRVCDQGPGIPAAQRDKVFDRFHRGAGEPSYGTGLGLSIVKQVADLHRGRVRLGERDPGLEVVIDLPAASGGETVPGAGRRAPARTDPALTSAV